ncbi:MAG TPA: prolipoprotein diacylglyceryl transferase family protein, partial [Erysipelothrix sp.]|nr:prolipoprotein diacylglyceryl transferase family protein [Erysipelothrix sp.]
TFLYESILNLIGWVLITQVLRRFKKLKRGDQSFAYLIWYGIVRFIIESFRTDALPLNLGFVELRIAQVISVLFMIVGLLGIMGAFKKLYESPKPILIFDFDGTVMDTQSLIIETFKQVFEKHLPGQVISEEEYLSFIGPTLYESFGRYFKQEEVQGMVDDYRRLNLELHEQYIKPMDHAKEVLFDLKDKGYKMAIVSSKVQEPILYGLKLTGMEDLFDPVYGMDNYDKTKPHPEGILKVMEEGFYDRSSFIYIGDTASDVEAGKRAGAFTIGYVFDNNREQALNDSKPNVVMSDWRELPEILEGDHEWTYNMI